MILKTAYIVTTEVVIFIQDEVKINMVACDHLGHVHLQRGGLNKGLTSSLYIFNNSLFIFVKTYIISHT